MEAAARVIAWNGKFAQPKESAGANATVTSMFPAGFSPLEDVLIVLPDDQLDALGTIFSSSPLRKAMTFEAYLVTKGFARE